MADSTYDLAPEGEPPPKPPERTERTQTPPPSKPAPTTASPSEPLQEMLCPHCGFRIVGKPRNLRCPDCRAPLDSGDSHLLQFADPNWVRHIAWGPLLLASAIAIHVAAVFIGIDSHRAHADAAMQVVAAALGVLGAWILTAPEPAQRRRSLLAILGRWLPILSLIMWSLTCVAAFRLETGVIKGTGSWVMATLLFVIVECFVLGFYGRELAERVPHDGLVMQLQALAWFLPVICLFLIVAKFFFLEQYIKDGFYCAFPMIGGLLGIMLWAIISLIRLTLAIFTAATASDAIAERKRLRAEAESKSKAVR